MTSSTQHQIFLENFEHSNPHAKFGVLTIIGLVVRKKTFCPLLPLCKNQILLKFLVQMNQNTCG